MHGNYSRVILASRGRAHWCFFGLAALFVSSSASAQSLPAAGDRIRTHLDGDEDATLEMDTTDGWVSVCEAPCDRKLLANGSYRVSGSDIRNSSPFKLTAEAGNTENLRVESRSTALFLLGTGTLVLGILGGLAGGVLVFAGTHNESCSTEASTSGSGDCEVGSNPDLIGGGAAVLVASGVLILTGAILMVTNSSSSVAQSASRSSHPSVAWLGQSSLGHVEQHRDVSFSRAPELFETPIFSASF